MVITACRAHTHLFVHPVGKPSLPRLSIIPILKRLLLKFLSLSLPWEPRQCCKFFSILISPWTYHTSSWRVMEDDDLLVARRVVPGDNIGATLAIRRDGHTQLGGSRPNDLRCCGCFTQLVKRIHHRHPEYLSRYSGFSSQGKKNEK